MTEERNEGEDAPTTGTGSGVDRAGGGPGAGNGSGADRQGPPRRARGARSSAAQEAAVAEMERTLEERQEQYLRLAADFENFRRRTAAELADRGRYGGEAAARELLPVLDNLRRATDHISEGGDEQLRDGLAMVVREFEAALERIGVQPITALGEAFDPALHDAVAGEESDDVDTETVIDELQRGYRLHDRVLRPAMVRIAHPRSG